MNKFDKQRYAGSLRGREKSQMAVFVVGVIVVICLAACGGYRRDLATKMCQTVKNINYLKIVYLADPRLASSFIPGSLRLASVKNVRGADEVSLEQLAAGASGCIIDQWGGDLKIFYYNNRLAIGSCGADRRWDGGRGDDIVVVLDIEDIDWVYYGGNPVSVRDLCSGRLGTQK